MTLNTSIYFKYIVYHNTFIRLTFSIEFFSDLVMLEFTSCILCPEMSEVIKLYLLPALKAQSLDIFPYNILISSLHAAEKSATNIQIDYSPWLLYSLLLLEPQNYGKYLFIYIHLNT